MKIKSAFSLFGSRPKATTPRSTSLGRTCSGEDDDNEELVRLKTENRRLRQVTQRIAAKIGVRSPTLPQGGDNSCDIDKDDDDEPPPPPPHLILAQAHRLQKLNELVVQLSQVPRVSQAYKLVAQYTREIVGAARVSLAMLVDPKDNEDTTPPHLEVYALDGDEGALPLGIQLSLHNTQVGLVVTTRQPVRVMNTRPDSGEAAAAWVDVQNLYSMGVRASIDVPLISSGRVLGTLNTGVTDPAVYQAANVESILWQIASVLAAAMEKEELWLLQQEQQQKDDNKCPRCCSCRCQETNV